MDLPDVLSDEEMSALESQASSAGSSNTGGGLSFDFSGGLPDVLSDEQMAALEQGAGSASWNFGDSLKQFGAGAMEGLGALGGFLTDMNPMKNIGDIVRARGEQLGIFEKDLTEKPYDYWRTSRQVKENLDKVLPAEDPQYHVSRTMGEFIGPSMIAPGSTALKLTSGVGGAAGQLLGEQATEGKTGWESKAVPAALSIFGAMSPSVLTGGAKSIWNALVPASDEKVTGTAGQILRDTTGLKAEDIRSAIKARPDDELGKMMTTAEITDNAGLAQLEKQLASAGPRAQAYSELGKQREGIRQGLIDSMSEVPAVNKEGLGSNLILAAEGTKEEMLKGAENLWKGVPRDVEINIIPQQAEIGGILDAKQAGLMPKGDAKNLLQQFLTAKEGKLTSGALQDIRSDTLGVLRDKNLSFIEKRALSALQSSIDDAMEQGLSGQAYERWGRARDATRNTAETFAQGTAGGSLLNDYARPSNVLANAIKGDTQSIQELRAAIAQQPELMESVKRGVLDTIGTDANNLLTPNRMKKFLSSNDGAVKELFGDEHYNSLYRILEDLQSEAKVSQNAFRASKGNSVTAQKNTVAGFLVDQAGRATNRGTGIIGRAFQAIGEGTSAKNQEAIMDVLFKAALDPAVAVELAAAPTSSRINSVVEILSNSVKNAGQSGVTAGVVQGQRNNAPLEEPVSDQGAQETAGQYLPEFFSAQNSNSPSLSVTQPTLPGPLQSETVNTQNNANPSKDKQSQQSKLHESSDTPEDVFINKLLDALRSVESAGNDKAVSEKGAKGPYQFMDITAKEYGLEDPFDEPSARKAAYAKIMDDWQRFGDLRLALAAYNAGPTAVARRLKQVGGDSYDDIEHLLPKETRNYVPKIEKVFQKLMQG